MLKASYIFFIKYFLVMFSQPKLQLLFSLLFLFPNPQLFAQKPAESYLPLEKAVASQLNTPIRVSVATIQSQLNQKMNGLIYETNNLEGAEGISIKVFKLKDVELKGENTDMFSTIPLRVEVRGDYKTNVFGLELSKNIDQDLRLIVRLKTTIDISEDWKLKTKTELIGYEWLDKPTINLGLVKISVASLVDGVIDEQKAQLLKQADEIVAKYIDIKTPIAEAWKTVQMPQAIADWTGDKIWLLNEVRDLTVSPLLFQRDTLFTVAHFNTFVRSEVSQKVATQNSRPLPPLKKVIQTQSEAVLNVNASINKKLAIQKAKEILMKQTFEFRNGKYKINVQDLTFYGSGERIVIQLELSGSVKGTVYLIGKPRFNTKTQQIEIEDFDYVMNAKADISKFTQWLFEGKIKKEIKKVMEDQINNEILKIRKDLEKTLQGYQFDKNTLLTGKLLQLEISKIQMSETALQGQILVKGNFFITILGF